MDATSTAELTIRMVVGLAVVLGLLALGTRLARRQVGRTKSVDIEVRGRQVLSKASSIAVVKVGRRHLLLGVNDGGVSLLAEGDDLILPSEPTDAALTVNGTENDVVDIRAGVLETLRQKTVRRS